MAAEGRYASDRWLTPGVVMVAIVVGGLVVGVIGAGVAYLQGQGIDPDPMLKLVTTAAAAVGTLVNSVMLLAYRPTATKIERNTNPTAVAGKVVEQLEATVYPTPAPAPAWPTSPPDTTAAAAAPGSYGLVGVHRPTIGPRS